MKRIVLIIMIVFVSLNSFAQSSEQMIGLGIVAGLNYNSNGVLNIHNVSESADKQLSAEKCSGFHAGVYLHARLGGFYIRPELTYRYTRSSYDSDIFYESKLEIPVLLGLNIIKPLSFFAGPSFQYVFKNGFNNFDYDEFEADRDIAVNAQFGLALQVGKNWRIDARYESGLSDNLAIFKNTKPLDAIVYTIHTKPNQLILSISFNLN